MPCYNIHNILYIDSQLSSFPRQFICRKLLNRSPDIYIEFREDNYFEENIKYADEIMAGIFFNKNNNILISRITILRFKCYFCITNFNEELSTALYLNKNFVTLSKRLVRIPVSSFFPLDHLMKLIIGLFLIKKGAVMVLSGGFQYSGNNFLVSSFGGMGKTTVVLDLFRSSNSDIKYLSDDTCILYKNRIYGYPQKIRIRNRGNAFLSQENYLDPTKFFNKKIIDCFQSDFILFLERSFTNITEKIALTSALPKLRCITDKTFPYFYERHLAALNYIYNVSAKYQETINNAYKNSLSGQCYILKGTANYYTSQISKLAKRAY